MKKLILVAGCLVLAASASAFAGNPAEGQEKSKACAACHGADGNSVAADFPKIAGQNEDYLVKALKDYKSGARKSPIMAPMGANLSTRDIEDLAAYFSGQKGLVLKH